MFIQLTSAATNKTQYININYIVRFGPVDANERETNIDIPKNSQTYLVMSNDDVLGIYSDYTKLHTSS